MRHRKNVHVMEDRYQRAQALLQGIWTKRIVRNATLFPHWVDSSESFWYERESRDGKEYRLVDATAATNKIAFDHQALAMALAKATGQTVNAENLPITKVSIQLSPLHVEFSAFDKQWVYDENSKTCIEQKSPPEDCVVSPDGRQAVFARDHNLWVRDLESGEERALTRDGEEDYVYGAISTAWGFEGEPPGCLGPRLQVRWSQDSKRLFTVQRDTRQVKPFPVLQHVPQDGSLRPTVSHYKVALPGDDHVEEYRLVVIDVETGNLREPNYQRVPATRNGYGFFNCNLGWWATDSRKAYFVDLSRDYKSVHVVEFDADTGATRILLEEIAETHINLMVNADEAPVFVPLPDSNELLWYSERSGWAHLYLYDLETGELKNTVTHGDWLVRYVLHVDAQRREAFIQTAGRVPDRDPYYLDLCRVHLDTGELTPLISSDHDYMIITPKGLVCLVAATLGDEMATVCGVSPSGDFAVVTRSRADQVPVSLLVDREGKLLLEIETADVSGLPEGWQWPERVKLLAADGKTDIYGQVFRPSDFSPDHSYPVISHVFNTPEMPWSSIGSFSNERSFLGVSYLDAAALAELGFIVVQIDGRGASGRDKAFMDASYGWVDSASSLEDHVTGLRQLAERYPYMDLNRVGITSHPFGGPGGVQGLMEYPDVYKVGVNGTHFDSRLMAASMWGNLYEGIAGPAAGQCYPEQLVANLRGKLLLMHNMLDMNVPPAATFRLVEALQKANKDFDLLLFPNYGHAVAAGYIVRRVWDYLVRYLLEIEPPEEFKLIHGFELRNKAMTLKY